MALFSLILLPLFPLLYFFSSSPLLFLFLLFILFFSCSPSSLIVHPSLWRSLFPNRLLYFLSFLSFFFLIMTTLFSRFLLFWWYYKIILRFAFYWSRESIFMKYSLEKGTTSTVHLSSYRFFDLRSECLLDVFTWGWLRIWRVGLLRKEWMYTSFSLP